MTEEDRNVIRGLIAAITELTVKVKRLTHAHNDNPFLNGVWDKTLKNKEDGKL